MIISKCIHSTNYSYSPGSVPTETAGQHRKVNVIVCSLLMLVYTNCFCSVIQTRPISKFNQNSAFTHSTDGSSKMAPELELKCKFQYNMEACVPQQWKINKYYISSTNNLPPCLKSSYSADIKLFYNCISN